MIRLLLIPIMLSVGCENQCFSREVGNCSTTYIKCWADCLDFPELTSCSNKCLNIHCRCLEKANCENDCAYKRDCELLDGTKRFSIYNQ